MMKQWATLGALIGLLASLALSRGSVRPLFDPSADPVVVPFQSGEKLAYRVHWQPVFATPAFHVGELVLQVEDSRYRGRESYRIIAHASSRGLLSSVAGFEVRNYFESAIDLQDLRSYRVLKKIRQGKRQRDIETIFDYQEPSIWVRVVDRAKDPPRELRRETVKGSTSPLTDILSVFYVMRVHRLKKGTEYQVPLSDNGKLYKMRVLVTEQEKVTTPIGFFETLELNTKGGFFKRGGSFRIWYSQDPLRVPVKFEADVRVGKVYGDLIHLEAPGLSQGLIPSE